MVLGQLVESAADDLAVDRPADVRDLLRPLVHQQHVQGRLGVVGADPLGDRLEDHRLSGLGGRDDECALALAEGGEDVDDAVGVVGLPLPHEAELEQELLVGMDRAQPVEVGASAHFGGRPAVHGGHPLEARAPALAAGARLALDLVAGAELVLADEALAHVDVAAGGDVARLATPEESAAPPDELENSEHQAVSATERLIR